MAGERRGMDERGLEPDHDDLRTGFVDRIAAMRAETSDEPECDSGLRNAIVDGSTDDLIARVRGLDEAARAALFAASKAWLEPASVGTGTWVQRLLGRDHDGALLRASLAWLALAPKGPLLKTVRKCHPWFLHVDEAVAVIEDRQPPWFDEFVGRIVAAAGCGDQHVVMVTEPMVPVVLGWVATGRAARPEGKAWLVVVRDAQRAEVAADPHLLEHELFDSIPIRPPAAYTWEQGWLHGTGVELVKEGAIDPLPLADALLAAAASTGQRWQVELAVEVLDLDGAAARAGTFVDLAIADIGRIPTFGQLDLLDRAGRLDPAEAARLGPALACPTAKWAVAAARMVASAAGEGPHADGARLALADGLVSPHDKVVVASAAALVDLPGDVTSAVSEAVRSRFGEMRPDQQVDLRTALARFLDEQDEVPGGADDRGTDAIEAAEEVAADWSAAERSAFGIDAVVTAWRHRAAVPPPDLDHQLLPVCTDARRLEALPDADALASLFLETIGSHPDPWTFELLVDGVHRFAGARPSAPLLEEIVSRYGRTFSEWFGFSRGIARLAGCWADDADLDYLYPVAGLVDNRLLAGAARTRSGMPGPALATPTHHGGWIDPVVLGERLDALTAGDLPAPIPDAYAAILRVAPDPTGALDRCTHPLAPVFAAAAADSTDLALVGRPGGRRPMFPPMDEGATLLDVLLQRPEIDPLDPEHALRIRAWALAEPERGDEAPLTALFAPGVAWRTLFPEDLPPAAAVVAAYKERGASPDEARMFADPDLRMGARGWDRLAAMLCGGKDGAVVATEVLTGMADDGRLDAAGVAAAIDERRAQGDPALARAAGLATLLAGHGPGPAELALQVLEQLALGEWPRSPATFVDALRAATIAAGRRPSPRCRGELESRTKGSTKTAKQCRAILDLELPDHPQDGAYRAALDARIARAARFGARPGS